MAKNTMPELYDEPEVGMKTAPTQEETLMNESDLLRGLLAAASEKDSESAYERIQIRRSGVLKFEFRIRPISEEESLKCRDHATKCAPEKGAAETGNRDEHGEDALLADLHSHRG